MALFPLGSKDLIGLCIHTLLRTTVCSNHWIWIFHDEEHILKIKLTHLYLLLTEYDRLNYGKAFTYL